MKGMAIRIVSLDEADQDFGINGGSRASRCFHIASFDPSAN
jgi:hypothetical protein